MSSESPTTDRRGFARRALAAVGAFFGALFGIPAAASVIDPVVRAAGESWHAAGSAAEVREGAPLRFAYEVATAWEKRKASGYLVRVGGEIVAFSSECTHLGCTVRAQEGEFRCPCHGGAFSLDGEPIRDPVTEPLRRFATRVRDGRVEVLV